MFDTGKSGHDAVRKFWQMLPLGRTAFAAILALAAVLRLLHLAQESAWLDELYSMQFVSARGLFAVFGDSFVIDYHPFWYYMLLDVWSAALGRSVFVARLLSALLGCCAVITAYLLAKSFFSDRRVAILCAFMAAVSPIHLMYSQEVRMYILLILVWPVFLIGLRACWRSQFAWPQSCALLAVFFVFAYAHGSSGLFALPLLVGVSGVFSVAQYRAGRKFDSFRGAFVAFMGLTIYLPWLVRLSLLYGVEKKLGTFGFHEGLRFLSWVQFGRSGPLVAFALCSFFILRSAFKWSHLLRKVVLPIIPLMASIIAVLAIQVVLAAVKPSYQSRNIVFLVSPILACVSFALVTLADLVRDESSRRVGRPLAFAAVCFLSAAFVFLMTYRTVHYIVRGYGKEQWREVVLEVEPKLQHGDVLVFYASYTQIAWDYYALDGSDSRRGRPSSIEYQKLGFPVTQDEQKILESVSSIVRVTNEMNGPNNSVWVFCSHARSMDRLEAVLKDVRLHDVDKWEWNGITLTRYVKDGLP